MELRWMALVSCVLLGNGGGTCLATDPPTYVIETPDILKVEASGLPKGGHMVQGVYLVRPDGTINLGTYGSVNVSGRTIPEACTAITKHLAKFTTTKRAVKVRVEINEYNSKCYYVVWSCKDEETVVRLPLRGNETVLDAVSQIDGFSTLTAKIRVEVVRDGTVRNVNWRAITRKGRMATNYDLRPRDVVRIIGATAK